MVKKKGTERKDGANVSNVEQTAKYSDYEPEGIALTDGRKRVLESPFGSEAQRRMFEIPFAEWLKIDRKNVPEWRCPVTSPVQFSGLNAVDCPIDAVAKRVRLYQGPVLNLQVDGIVNAANSKCMGGGGVDGAIHRAAGPLLLRECCTFNGCKVGHTRITKAYNLPARYVLHTVGPIGEHPNRLASCYRTCLLLCKRHSLRTIGFCCVSTGVYGYPLAAATAVAVKTVAEMLCTSEMANAVDGVVFACFKRDEFQCYTEELKKLH